LELNHLKKSTNGFVVEANVVELLISFASSLSPKGNCLLAYWALAKRMRPMLPSIAAELEGS
jgi:hypothetical protein